MNQLLLSSSVGHQFSHPTLQPHEPQHARPPCPSPTPGVYPNSCPLSRWCHLTISSSVILALNLSLHQGLFQWVNSLHKVASIGVSASASVLAMNIQDWFALVWTGWIFLQSKGLSSLLQQHSSKASILRHSTLFIFQLSHPYTTTGKTIPLTRRTTFVDKIMSLLFNMLSRLVITFLPRSKRLLISWLQSPSAVFLEPPKLKSAAVATVSPSIFHEVMGPDAWSYFSECPALSQLFHSPLSLSSRGFLVPLHFLQ